MLFTEEVRNLFEKLPFPCLHAGFISNNNTVKEGTVLATTRPGFPVLPDMEDGPNETTNRIQAGASCNGSAVETGKLQQGSDGLKEAMQQLTTANEELRDTVDECEEGMVRDIRTWRLPALTRSWIISRVRPKP